MKTWFLLILAALPFMMTACGSGSSHSGSSSSISSSSVSQSLSYEYSENGCDTGKHEFPSMQDYCKGLEDSSLNHGCASDLRQEDFQNNCATPWMPS